VGNVDSDIAGPVRVGTDRFAQRLSEPELSVTEPHTLITAS